MTTGRNSTAVVAVAGICTGLGASLGFLPGFLATSLGDDLGLSRGQVGLLVSLYFGCTGVGSVLGGRVTELLGARLVVVIDMVLVASAGAFSAFVGTYWSLLVAAVVAGLGYALVNAGTNVAVARCVEPRRRTLAMSVKTAGVPTMAAITAALGPWSANRWGWERISAVVGVLAVGAAILAFLVLDDDRPVRSSTSGRSRLPDGFVWFPIGAFLLIAGSQPLYSWVVAYLEQSLDASPSVAGSISAIGSLIGVAVMIFSATRADRLSAERRLDLILVLMGLNVVGTLLVLAGEVAGIGITLIGTILGISAQLSAIGTMHAAIVDRAPDAVARATGWTMTGYYLGALLSPVAFGLIVDATGGFSTSWAATIVLLVLSIAAWYRAGKVTKGDLSWHRPMETDSPARSRSSPAPPPGSAQQPLDASSPRAPAS